MQKIYYTFYQYKNWELLIGATEKGLCYIGFEDTRNEQLIQSCNKQFQNCMFIKNSDQLMPYIKELNNYFEGSLTTFTVPLHFQGTKFQMKVWNALLTIEYGKTVPYSYIATVIKNPKAIRAVGTAIGKNPIPIIIPCHRVINKDGSIGGYSGGLHIKKQLLTIENVL